MFEPKVKNTTKFLNLVLSDSVIGITLAPFGIYIKKGYNKQTTIDHEKIHWQQQLEMLIIFFYLWYIIEWFIKKFTNKGNAYRSVSFEREAYGNEKNENYLTTRKYFSWVKYITLS